MPAMPPAKTAALEPPVNLSRVKGKLTNTLNEQLDQGPGALQRRKQNENEEERKTAKKATKKAKEPASQKGSETEGRSCRHLGWNAAVRRVLLP
jgi:hypothetical protein